MTRHEATVISAYTGYLFCRPEDLYAYLAKKIGCPVFTQELTKEFFESIHDAVLEDLVQLEFCGSQDGDAL